MKACKTIFYFDGFYTLVVKPEVLLDYAEQVRSSKYGLMQKRHPYIGGGSAIEEFAAILEHGKDIERNVNASIEWLWQQPDFHNNCTLYQNSNFCYDPSNEHFRQVAQFFWDHYAQELDSWRDQPLWCYSLQHFHVKPLTFPEIVFKGDGRRKGHKAHTYGELSDNDASI